MGVGAARRALLRVVVPVSPLQHRPQARVKVVSIDAEARALADRHAPDVSPRVHPTRLHSTHDIPACACPAQTPCSHVAPVPGWASAGDRSPLGDGGLDNVQTACHARLLPPLPQES